MHLSRRFAAVVCVALSICLLTGAARARSAAHQRRHTLAAQPGPGFAPAYRAGDRSTAAPRNGPTTPLAPTGTPKTFHALSFYNMRQTQIGPGGYIETAMDYDAVRKQTVLFGGCTTATPCQSNETWTFDGDFWTKKTPATSPPARDDSVLVFDQAHSNLVLFGGTGSSGTDLADTWIWNGTTWTQQTPATAPSARDSMQAAYLPSIGKVVLFGGKNGSTHYGDTWTWNGTTWAQLSPATSPPAREDSELAYAGASGKLLLYGGKNAGGELGDTWLFDGTTWTQQSPQATPGPRDSFSMAYDPTLHVPLLQSGKDNTGTYYHDTWAWDGSDWELGGSNLQPWWGGVPGEADGAMAQTPTNGQLLYVGGTAPSIRINDTFRLDFNDTGFRPAYKFQDARITDRTDDHANIADQDLLYRATDFDVPGVGLDFTLERQHNNLVARDSHLLPLGWSLGLLDVYTFTEPDGARLLFGPDAHEYLFQKSGTGTWSAPSGSDFGTLADQPDGTRTVTRQHPKITYTFKNEYLISAADRNGNKITINRDVNNKITSIVDTQGRTYSVGYNANGFIDHITDPTGRSVTYGYDGSANLTSVTISDPNDPVGSATTNYVYGPEGNGWMSQVTTPAGRIVKYTYGGGMNRLSKIVRVSDPVAGTGPTTNFDAISQPGKVLLTDPNAHTTTYTLDLSGSDHLSKISKATDPNGHNRSSSYDSSDNLTGFNGDNVSAAYQLAYDANNNITAFTTPSSNGTNTPYQTTFKYTAPGQPFLPSSSSDSNSDCRSFGYDTAGNLTDVYDNQTSPCDGLTNGNHFKNAYQGDSGVSCGAKQGELCSTTDGRSNVTSYNYDANGNLTAIHPPAPMAATTIVPDSLGRPSSVTDAKGQKATYTYDKADRVTKILFNSAVTCDTTTNCITYAYDADGNITSRVSNIGTTSYTYDNLARLTKKALPGPLVDACAGDNGMKIGYDSAGNVTSYCDARGTVTYGYDAANDLTSIQEPGGNCSAVPVTGPCTKIGYVDSNGKFQDGRRTSVTFPPSSNVVESLAYDNAGNLTSIGAKRGTTVLTNFQYTYVSGTKDVGVRKTMVDTTGTTTTFQYDHARRLCYYVTGTSSNACSSPPAGATSFTYDGNSNRLKKTSGGTTTNYAYNADNELCQVTTGTASCSTPNYTYDGNGNTTSTPAISSLVYNAKDQNTSRTFSGSTTNFAFADADQTERVTAGSTNFATSPLGLSADSTGVYYTRDTDGGLIGQQSGGANYYVLFDGLGSIVGEIDSAGTLVKTLAYDPFGNRTTLTGTGPTPAFQYANGYFDSSGVLTKFGTRYYEPSIGRWTQQDPLPGAIADPRNLDRYVYVACNPVNFVDPNGLGLLDAFKDFANIASRFILGETACYIAGETLLETGLPGFLATGVVCATAATITYFEMRKRLQSG
jgi:RHS repeat-associated protein